MAIEVRGGATESTVVSGDPTGLGLSVDEWFALLNDLGESAVTEFDESLGFPVVISGPEAGSDESIRITSFVLLDGAALDVPTAAAGIHECALLTRGDVDRFFAHPAPLGTYSAPLVQVATCHWDRDNVSLTMTLFPSSQDIAALVADHERVNSMDWPAVIAQDSGAITMVVDLGRATLMMEARASDDLLPPVERLMDVATAAAQRVPGSA